MIALFSKFPSCFLSTIILHYIATKQKTVGFELIKMITIPQYGTLTRYTLS